MPRVSIVIPNYNYAEFLPKRLDSVFSQTYNDYEVIVVDDASSDNSVEIIKSFPDKRCKIIVNEHNSGCVFKQWKKGIENATGEYIWIAESDDFCEPSFLETMVKMLDKYKNAGFGYCRTAAIDKNDKLIPSVDYIKYTDYVFPNCDKWLSEHSNDGRNEVSSYMATLCTIINVSSVLFRKNAILEPDLIDINLKQSGDWMTYIKILRKFDICYTPKILNYHRLHPNKNTNNTITNLTYFKDMLKIFKYTHNNFDIPLQMKNKQFLHIIEQWYDHFNGPNGKISKLNNLKLLIYLLKFYPTKIVPIFSMYFKTLSIKK